MDSTSRPATPPHSVPRSHLLDHPDEAERLGKAARHTIESAMSLDLWADRISSVISDTGRAAAKQNGRPKGFSQGD